MNNGWTKIEKARGGSSYEKYKNQIVVIVPEEKHQDHVCFTAACYEALGKPKKVDYYTRGTNVAICASDGSGYTVSTVLNRSDAALYYTSPTKWRRSSGIKPGIYTAHIESGMIVFDSAQTPAKI